MKSIALGLCLVLLSIGQVFASPVGTLESASNKLMGKLKSAKQPVSLSAAQHWVQEIILPIVDRETMAKSMVGPVAWKAASGAERQEFIRLMTKRVVGTYARAISRYQNERVQWGSAVARGAGQMSVRSQIVRSSGPNVSMNYVMSNQNGQWRVVDFSVEGVGLVQSMRTQFQSLLNQGGLSAVNQQLKGRG